MPNQPLISVVAGSCNRVRLLRLFIESVRAELEGVPSEIIVVDGGSTDGSVDWLARQKDVVTVVQHNRGVWNGRPVPRRSWGYFMNLGFKAAQGRYVCMLSDDCLVVPGAIRNGAARLDEMAGRNQPAGGLAFYWRNWPGMDDYAVYEFWGLTNLNHGLYLRQALERVGFADEETCLFYYADVDLSFRLHHAGLPVLDAPDSFVEHYCHADQEQRRGNEDASRGDEERFLDKWRALMPERDFSEANKIRVRRLAHEDPHQTLAPFVRIHNSPRTRIADLAARARARLKRGTGK